jgi:hypothetical protein
MRQFLLSFFLLGWWALAAQPIVDQSSLPTAGYEGYRSVADTLLPSAALTAGANQTWDFTGLSPVSQLRDSFIARAAAPFSLSFQFPIAANLVRVQGASAAPVPVPVDQAYEFQAVTSDAYISYGTGVILSGLPLALVNDPPDTLLDLPLTFGQQDSSYTQAELTVPGLVYLRREQARSYEVDAWGDLQTPFGTFSCLRVASTLYAFDTLSFDTLQIGQRRDGQQQFQWWSPTLPVPVMEVILPTATAPGGGLSGVTYADSLRVFDLVSREQRASAPALRLFPQPAKDRVSIEAGAGGSGWTLEVFDQQGRRQRTWQLGPGLQQLDVSNLPAGLYEVRARMGETWRQGRLLITR